MRRLLMAVCFVVLAVAVVLASGCGSDTGPTSGGTSPNSKQVEKEKRR